MSMLYLQWIKFKNWLCYLLFPELNKPPGRAPAWTVNSGKEEPLEGVLSNPRVVKRTTMAKKPPEQLEFDFNPPSRPKTNTKKKIRITTKKKESVK